MFNSACITRYSWFVEMSRLRNELMEIIKINWVPEHIKEGRFGEWLKEARIGQFRATVIGERLCLFGNAGTRIAPSSKGFGNTKAPYERRRDAGIWK